MTSSSVQSTALIPHVSSGQATLFWSKRLDSLQESIVKKSFQAQIADYQHFNCTSWKNLLPFLEISQLSSNLKNLSIDSAIRNAQSLSRTQLFLKIMSKSFLQYSKQFHLAYRQSYLFLNQTIEVINASSQKDLQDRSEQLSDLFFRILPKCHYDRSLITSRSALESVLDNAVYQPHGQSDVEDPITGLKVRETISEALFAQRLGVKLEKADSKYHSIYYLLNRSKKKLGVFKPSIQENPQDDRYGASEDREGHLAEAASSTVDRFLETKVVPHTQLLTCSLSSPEDAVPLTGSFQFYVEGCDLDSQVEGENLFDPNHTALAMRLDTPANRELKFRNLEEFALFDLLTANNDHHFKNILLKKVAKKVWDLVAIDNANSFPWCHDLDLPSYKIHPIHWFKWSTLPQALIPFSNFMINRINTLDMHCLEKIARNELVSKDVPSSEEHIEGKIKTLRERYARIKHLANKQVSLRAIATDLLTLTAQK